MNQTLLKPEERAIFALRELYRSYGYLPFKMSKFEEYDFYVRSKEFLVSSDIITFNDKNGRLMALKPDVTCSIVKTYTGTGEDTEKVYYNENVYRPDGGTHEFKEIPQTGIECIGRIDSCQIFEVLTLAAKSLAALSEDYVLAISHLGIISGLVAPLENNQPLQHQLMQCVGSKNSHELRLLCRENGLSGSFAERLAALIQIYAPMEDALSQLDALGTSAPSGPLQELQDLCRLLQQSDLASHIRLDFSIVNDMRYYNSILFRGYLPGIPQGILSGGRYDNLLHRLGKKGSAIGFAVYLDLLEQFSVGADYDVDTLLLYDEDCNPAALQKTVEQLSRQGERVTAQRHPPAKLRWRRKLYFRNGRVETDGSDD